MSEINAEISMSLDGFIAGPDDTVEQGLGVGGERLHEWLYGLESWRSPHGLGGGTADSDSALLAEGQANSGRPLFGGLGAGLIELERVHAIGSPNVTHLKFRFPRDGAC
ncbi:MAG TPA: hypothetical protein VD886_23400 [Herpetosiphonaceae bacterium]|nr:hypothetical protein [Herpetosiphonaceae bacterium]